MIKEPKKRVVRARPGTASRKDASANPNAASGGEKLGHVEDSSSGGARDRLTIQLEGKMAMLARGEISVADMDNEELARLQFKAADGTFRGRPPSNVPAQLLNLMRRELLDRLAEKRREVLEEMQDIAISIARHGDKDGDRLKALQYIVDRELGKTPEKVEIANAGDPFQVQMVKAVRIRRPTGGDDDE